MGGRESEAARPEARRFAEELQLQGFAELQTMAGIFFGRDEAEHTVVLVLSSLRVELRLSYLVPECARRSTAEALAQSVATAWVRSKAG